MNLEDDIYQEIDGFYVLDTSKGFITSARLREIADKLDELNAPWQELVNDYYDGNIKDW